ncbi:MAG: DUF4115 domain-containing protein [Ignavibacteria bacterium]|nr:DUF4115 domain-containing protein [Ignavibacteria bacterium]
MKIQFNKQRAMNPLSERLRSRREELTLSVKEISARTKIRPNVINALEEGNFDVLPRVYITSFVRNYGALLEIPDEELDELWVASGLDNPAQETAGFSLSSVLQSGRENSTSTPQSSNSNSPNKPTSKIKPVQPTPRIISAMVYSAFVIGCAALVYYFLIRETPKVKNSGESVPTAEIRPDSGEGGFLNSLFDESLPKDSIILEATATDSVWLTINADGTRSDQLLMTPGSTKRWSAKTQFILSLGNAGAIQLKRDNVSLPSLGKIGTALRYVKITKDEVNTSASPYKNQDSLARISTIAAEKKAAAIQAANVKKLQLKPSITPAKQAPTLTKPVPQQSQSKQTNIPSKQLIPQAQTKAITTPNQVKTSSKQPLQPITKSTSVQDKQTVPTVKQAEKPAASIISKSPIKVTVPAPSKSGNPLKIAPPVRKQPKSSKPKGKHTSGSTKKKSIVPITTAPLKQPSFKPSPPPRL